jgi:hypothetical protein
MSSSVIGNKQLQTAQATGVKYQVPLTSPDHLRAA